MHKVRGRIAGVSTGAMQSCKFLDGDALVVPGPHGPLVGEDGVACEAELAQAIADGTPHARVRGSKGSGFAEVVEGILIQVQHLVRLSQAIPCAIVGCTHVDGAPVRRYGRTRVFQLDIFVPHERPCRQKPRIHPQTSLEIADGTLMLAFEGVVIAYDAAGLGQEFVHFRTHVSQVRQLRPPFLHIQDIRVCIDVFHSVRISLPDRLERLLCGIEIPHVVMRQGKICTYPKRLGENFFKHGE
jgi:hypothetical protein